MSERYMDYIHFRNRKANAPMYRPTKVVSHKYDRTLLTWWHAQRMLRFLAHQRQLDSIEEVAE